MKHVKTKVSEQGEEILCQLCDETFFHLGEKEPVCPKCGKSDKQWLLSLPVQEEEEREYQLTGTE